jgi:hypothetical protein
MESESANHECWSIDYTLRDWEIVDYHFYELPGLPGIFFRGPALDLDNTTSYFSCIGAAQTMGVYVEKPYPTLLAQQLGMPALNLALGAAGPGFYAERDDLIALVNRSKFLILQIMAARSESNVRMEPAGFIELVRDRKTGEVLGSGQAWMRLLAEDKELTRRCVAENQRNWVEHYKQILAKVRVPVILFWFSPREQDVPLNYDATNPVEFMGGFPHLVDAACVKAVAPLCAGYAECYSARNTGHPLVSRFTGQPVEADYGKLHESLRGLKETANLYYPSPEMHADAAAVLLEKIQAMAAENAALLARS